MPSVYLQKKAISKEDSSESEQPLQRSAILFFREDLQLRLELYALSVKNTFACSCSLDYEKAKERQRDNLTHFMCFLEIVLYVGISICLSLEQVVELILLTYSSRTGNGHCYCTALFCVVLLASLKSLLLEKCTDLITLYRAPIFIPCCVMPVRRTLKQPL